MAIKINLMPESQKKGWQIPQGDQRIYSTTLVIFLFSLLALSGVYIYKFYILPNELASLEKETSILTDRISTTINSDMISTSKKAKGAEVILNDRLYWSKFFDTLESLTLKNISYDQFTLKPGTAKNAPIVAEIDGHTNSFALLSKQVAVFISRKEFSNITFNGGEMDKDGIIKFKVGLEINQSYIKDKK